MLTKIRRRFFCDIATKFYCRGKKKERYLSKIFTTFDVMTVFLSLSCTHAHTCFQIGLVVNDPFCGYYFSFFRENHTKNLCSLSLSKICTNLSLTMHVNAPFFGPVHVRAKKRSLKNRCKWNSAPVFL